MNRVDFGSRLNSQNLWALKLSQVSFAMRMYIILRNLTQAHESNFSFTLVGEIHSIGFVTRKNERNTVLFFFIYSFSLFTRSLKNIYTYIRVSSIGFENKCEKLGVFVYVYIWIFHHAYRVVIVVVL